MTGNRLANAMIKAGDVSGDVSELDCVHFEPEDAEERLIDEFVASLQTFKLPLRRSPRLASRTQEFGEWLAVYREIWGY